MANKLWQYHVSIKRTINFYDLFGFSVVSCKHDQETLLLRNGSLFMKGGGTEERRVMTVKYFLPLFLHYSKIQCPTI